MIYFIRDPKADRVKIGFSTNPWLRVTKIRSDSSAPLILEAVIDGDRAAEAELHELFKDRHSHGEWFVWGGAVALYVAGLDRRPRPRLPTARTARLTEINRAIFTLGFSGPYASQLQRGRRPWPLDIAIGVWKLSGHQVGPLSDATADELSVLAKYAAHFRPSRPQRNAKAA